MGQQISVLFKRAGKRRCSPARWQGGIEIRAMSIADTTDLASSECSSTLRLGKEHPEKQH
jgi:hypothetical protein